jgi:hypothetical protein
MIKRKEKDLSSFLIFALQVNTNDESDDESDEGDEIAKDAEDELDAK